MDFSIWRKFEGIYDFLWQMLENANHCDVGLFWSTNKKSPVGVIPREKWWDWIYLRMHIQTHKSLFASSIFCFFMQEKQRVKSFILHHSFIRRENLWRDPNVKFFKRTFLHDQFFFSWKKSPFRATDCFREVWWEIALQCPLWPARVSHERANLNINKK